MRVSACANVCNVYMMRQSELKSGIDVEDEQGNIVGTSKVAARKVVIILYLILNTSV